MSTVEFLSSVPGFDSLDPALLQKVLDQSKIVDFADGEHVIRRGDPGDAMHVLCSGAVRIPVFDARGRVRLVAQLGPGDVFGEMALLTGARRRADVISEGGAQTIVLARDTIAPLLAEHPPLARFLTEILGARLEDSGGIEQVGKYRLLGKLGEGATSKVYEALHPSLNRAVAVKMLGHHLVYDRDFRDRFLQEARTIAGLSHPNIVQVYDTEKAYATWFIVMEKVEGGDLLEHLKAIGRMDVDPARDVLRQVSAALSFAHSRGIVHRDVKPANVALDEDGTVKLMDFGIAQKVQDGAEGGGSVEGTPRYIAPEAVLGKGVDGRADIYSLGVMAFEMLTGRPLFQAETLRELLQAHARRKPPDLKRLRPELPDELVNFVMGALAKDPANRLQDWGRIDAMLAGGEAAELSMQTFEERIVRIRYRPADRKRIDRAVGVLRRGLRPVQWADVAEARLHSEGANAPDGDTETGPDRTFSGIFAKIRGRSSGGSDTTDGGNDFESTRVQAPWED